MHPDLVKLLDLQEKDLALVEVDTRLAGILGEIEQLDKQLAEAERTLESRRRSAAEALRKRQESETKIENYRRLVERQQARTDQLHWPTGRSRRPWWKWTWLARCWRKRKTIGPRPETT